MIDGVVGALPRTVTSTRKVRQMATLAAWRCRERAAGEVSWSSEALISWWHAMVRRKVWIVRATAAGHDTWPRRTFAPWIAAAESTGTD